MSFDPVPIGENHISPGFVESAEVFHEYEPFQSEEEQAEYVDFLESARAHARRGSFAVSLEGEVAEE